MRFTVRKITNSNGFDGYYYFGESKKRMYILYTTNEGAIIDFQKIEKEKNEGYLFICSE